MTDTAVALLRAVRDHTFENKTNRKKGYVSYSIRIYKALSAFLDQPEKPCFEVTLEELEAISRKMHGHSSIRFNPDEAWTAQHHLALQGRIDAEIALRKAEGLPNGQTDDCRRG